LLWFAISLLQSGRRNCSQQLALRLSSAFCETGHALNPIGLIEVGGAHIALDHLQAATTRHSPGTSKPVGDSKLRMEFSTSFQTDSRS
jgi:hypothetical protein